MNAERHDDIKKMKKKKIFHCYKHKGRCQPCYLTAETSLEVVQWGVYIGFRDHKQIILFSNIKNKETEPDH